MAHHLKNITSRYFGRLPRARRIFGTKSIGWKVLERVSFISPYFNMDISQFSSWVLWLSVFLDPRLADLLSLNSWSLIEGPEAMPCEMVRKPWATSLFDSELSWALQFFFRNLFAMEWLELSFLKLLPMTSCTGLSLFCRPWDCSGAPRTVIHQGCEGLGLSSSQFLAQSRGEVGQNLANRLLFGMKTTTLQLRSPFGRLNAWIKSL